MHQGQEVEAEDLKVQVKKMCSSPLKRVFLTPGKLIHVPNNYGLGCFVTAYKHFNGTNSHFHGWLTAAKAVSLSCFRIDIFIPNCLTTKFFIVLGDLCLKAWTISHFFKT
jgi:hypothetical protein